MLFFVRYIQDDKGMYQEKACVTETCLSFIFFDFSLTVKAAPHECVIRTGQP